MNEPVYNSWYNRLMYYVPVNPELVLVLVLTTSTIGVASEEEKPNRSLCRRSNEKRVPATLPDTSISSAITTGVGNLPTTSLEYTTHTEWPITACP
jgi:hypothetical protein